MGRARHTGMVDEGTVREGRVFPWLDRFGPALAAVLLALSFPPLHLPPLPFVALVPLALWAAGLPGGAPGRGDALRGGFLFGAVHFGILFHWVPLALVGPGADVETLLFALLAFVVIVVGLAALAAVFVWLLHRAFHVHHAPLWLALPVTWTAFEWVRAHLPGSLALPWLGLGTSLTGTPELLGVAELVGGRGVTFWIASVNGLVASLLLALRGPERRWQAPALATVVVLLVPAAWGVHRAATLETRPAATVAVVQPDRGGRVKLSDDGVLAGGPRGGVDGVGGSEAAGREGAAGSGDIVAGGPGMGPEVVERLRPGAPDLVVLPELFVRGDPRGPSVTREMDALEEESSRLQAPILFGGLGLDTTREGEPVPYNSVYLLRPEGLTGFRYDKRHLVPVVERIPFLPPGVRRGLAARGGYGVGEGWPLAEVDGTSYGVLVCYESSYPEAARSLRRGGADVLVNVTNDAWLGGAGPVARTIALWQHPAHLVLRAVEHRMGAVRSANTGISFFVDPVGRTWERTGLFVPDQRTAVVRTTDVETVFTRFGDVLGSASALAVAGLLLLALVPPGTGAGGRRGTSPALDRSARDV